MVSGPPPPPKVWKFAKVLWGQNFFLDLWGDKPLWGELKLYVGSNFY